VLFIPPFLFHVSAAGSYRKEEILLPGAEYHLEGVEAGATADGCSNTLLQSERPVLKKGMSRTVREEQCYCRIVAPIPKDIHGLRYGREKPKRESPRNAMQSVRGRVRGHDVLFVDPNAELQNSRLKRACLVQVFEYTTTGSPRLTLGGANFWQDSSVNNLHVMSLL